jgi:hypothetical protein
MKLSELKSIAVEKKIVGRSIMNKPELEALLREKGFLSEDPPIVSKRDTNEGARYEYLKSIRHNPRRVKVEDVETGEEVEYPSLYKAGRAVGVNSKRIIFYDGRIMNDRYKINIIGNQGQQA